MSKKEFVIDRLEIYNSSKALQVIELQGKDKLLQPIYSYSVDYNNMTKEIIHKIELGRGETAVFDDIDGSKLMIMMDLEEIEEYKNKIKNLESAIKSRMKYIKRMEEGLVWVKELCNVIEQLSKVLKKFYLDYVEKDTNQNNKT